MIDVHRFTTLFGLLLAVALLSIPVRADEPAGVGLVIQMESGEVVTRCIESEDNELSGADVLIHSGLDVVLDTGSGMGVIVCQIQGEGCAFPGEPCFCDCMGGDECTYWNYFYRDPGGSEWVYSVFGAAGRHVKPGSVEAWVWGDGQTPPADDLSFERICAAPTPTMAVANEDTTPTRNPPPTLAQLSPSPTAGTPPSAQAPVASPTPTATSLPLATVSPAGTPDEGNPVLASYWPFGLMVLGLAAIGAVVWLRRARES